MLLAVTYMSKYIRLTEEIFSALSSCIFIFGARMKVYSGFVDLRFKPSLFTAVMSCPRWLTGRAAPLPVAERARRAAALARNARRRASGAAGMKLSWNGKRWAVAVAGPRPTVDRENRGGVRIRVQAYLAFWSAFWS